MADAGVLVELWQGGGGWLVCAGVAWLLIQRLSPAIVSYINAKATFSRRMTEAVDKVLTWPEQFNVSIHDLKTQVKAVERRMEDHTDAIEHLTTVLEIQPRKPLRRKDSNDQAT